MRTAAPIVALVIAILACPGEGARAQVTFEEAIALSQRAPRLEGARGELEARRREDADLAGTSQGVAIQATPGARVLSEQDRGFEGQLTVTHSWNLGDLTGARRRAAAAERGVLSAEARAVALEVRLDAARRWIELWRLDRLERVVRAERELAARFVAHTERALRAGVATAMDESEAGAYAAEVLSRALTLEGQRHEASLALALAMARPPSAELRPRGPLPSPALPDDPAPYLRAVDDLPAVAVERLAARAARAHEAEAAASYAPIFGAGVQLQRESPSGFIAQGVLTLTVPLMDQGQRQRSVARGEAARREGARAQARLTAARELSLAIHDVEHQRRELAALRERLLPSLTRLLERREAALRAGESTVFDVAAARRRLLEARGRAIEAAAARAWAEVRLWILLAETERAGRPE